MTEVEQTTRTDDSDSATRGRHNLTSAPTASCSRAKPSRCVCVCARARVCVNCVRACERACIRACVCAPSTCPTPLNLPLRTPRARAPPARARAARRPIRSWRWAVQFSVFVWCKHVFCMRACGGDHVRTVGMPCGAGCVCVCARARTWMYMYARAGRGRRALSSRSKSRFILCTANGP